MFCNFPAVATRARNRAKPQRGTIGSIGDDRWNAREDQGGKRDKASAAGDAVQRPGKRRGSKERGIDREGRQVVVLAADASFAFGNAIHATHVAQAFQFAQYRV